MTAATGAQRGAVTHQYDQSITSVRRRIRNTRNSVNDGEIVKMFFVCVDMIIWFLRLYQFNKIY
jgi:hypothetical protein